MSTELANEVLQIVEDLDSSQLKLEKNAFDVINSSDTSLNLVKDGIKEIEGLIKKIDDLNKAVEASNILFGNASTEALRSLDEDTLLAVFDGVPQFEVSREVLAVGVKAVDLTTDHAAIFASKGEMRKLVQGGGVSVNKEKLAAFDQLISTENLLNDKYILVQKGKKNYYLIIVK